MVVRQADSIGAPAFLAYLFWPGGMLFTRVLYGYHIVNPIDVIHNVACPILFMHEEYDEFTSSEETQRLFKAAGNPADEVWEVSYTKHSQTFKTHPQEFVEMVDKFLSAKTEGMPAE
jgi:pimeloyl-ACP methyl ester carboxylesterase